MNHHYLISNTFKKSFVSYIITNLLLFNIITIINPINTEISFDYRPFKILIKPLKNLPNWIQAPIPIYKPPPVIPYVKMNDLMDRCKKRYNVKIPETPTMLNVIHNAVVFKTGDIMTSNYFYLHEFEPKTIDIMPIEKFDQAIPFFHEFSKCYFHFIIETFPLLVSYGSNITRNSVLIHGSLLKRQFNDLCSILNLSFKKTVYVGTPVFVKKLIITNPYDFDKCNPNALRHFRHLIISKLKIENLKATENLLYNRKDNRRITNFNELYATIQNEIQNISFQLYIDSKRIIDQIKLFRKSRFIMFVHGSTLSNMIFMHKKSVVFELAKKTCRPTFLLLSKVIGIRLHEIYFPNQTFYYYDITVDIPVLVNAIKKIMIMLDSE